jgi:hypothetical protein
MTFEKWLRVLKWYLQTAGGSTKYEAVTTSFLPHLRYQTYNTKSSATYKLHRRHLSASSSASSCPLFRPKLPHLVSRVQVRAMSSRTFELRASRPTDKIAGSRRHSAFLASRLMLAQSAIRALVVFCATTSNARINCLIDKPAQPASPCNSLSRLRIRPGMTGACSYIGDQTSSYSLPRPTQA